MGAIDSRVSSILLDRVAEWLTNSSLAGDDLENIVRGFCERIAAAGPADCPCAPHLFDAAPAL
jgi:adenylate cyclase